MLTIAYVDGYNLYHGRLKHTPYKWLDLSGLLAHLLQVQSPDDEIASVKFFTANIKARLARLGQQSVDAQHAYHRALEARGVEIIHGRFTLTEETAPRLISTQPINRDDRVPIWRLSEKQTDVRLALQIYRDVAAGRCQQVMLCTNDSDLAPVLEALRSDFPNIRIGVVLPRTPAMRARKSGTLEQLAHWTRHHIHDEELLDHQLPARVPTRKKPIDKPLHW